jgi:eukaryotic-like serine/threonine-protein kinase
MPLTPGQILNNRYRLVKLLGQGGFGAVYQAWDINLEKLCALKENIDTTEAAQRQFKREARILSDLSHPNLPRVIDHFIIPGRGQYLVMDYIEGEDLQEKLDKANGPLPVSQALQWIEQVCDALEYLHSQEPPVIHRDIKPANIKISSQSRAILVDFGIAKIYDPSLKTTTGAQAVTPGFSPPEQYGKGITDGQSDIYALGATLYTLLTGQEPPASVDILAKNCHPPPSANSVNSAISPGVSKTIELAMQLEKASRFRSAAEFKVALKKNVASLVGQKIGQESLSASVTPTAKASSREIQWELILIGIAICLVAVIVLGLLFSGQKSANSPTTNNPVLILTTESISPIITETPFITTPKLETANPILKSTSTVAPPSNVLPDRIIDDYGVPMALVPAGEFIMGSLAGGSDERPLHRIRLDSFYMDVYEVTNARYAQCEQAGACEKPQNIGSFSHEEYYGNAAYNDYPVIFVTWFSARAYCEWRGVRLPTEAEWEKAAHGWLEDATYPWGNEAPVCQPGVPNGARFDDYDICHDVDTSAVGMYAPNGYGLFDMAGNVWEWVSSLYNPYPYLAGDGREEINARGLRVLRGGSWRDNLIGLTVFDRGRSDPSIIDYDFGFRCARSP